MKTITIIGATKAEIRESVHQKTKDVIAEGPEAMSVFDGYHTMDELYEHRAALFIALCRLIAKQFPIGFVWRSKLHYDGTSYDGWFVLGLFRDFGAQITYHLPLDKWEETNFAETLEKAPEFDGHTSDDVLQRLGGLDDK